MTAYQMKGKMIKHKLLAARPEMRAHLPKTYWLTVSSAKQLLKSSSSIFIKPNFGSGGTGIIKVSKLEKNGYLIRSGRKRIRVNSSELYRNIRAYQNSGKSYLVQQGLQLANYKGRIFDVRMYLQKPQSVWLVSGMVARVAATGRYVTNHYQGGHAVELETVLGKLFAGNKRKVQQCINVLRNRALIAAETLEMRFSDIRELGIDFGIESSGHVWFIEANSRPLHRLFTQLPDKTMLNRIREIKRHLAKREGWNE